MANNCIKCRIAQKLNKKYCFECKLKKVKEINIQIKKDIENLHKFYRNNGP